MTPSPRPSSPVPGTARACWQVRLQGFNIPSPGATPQSVSQLRPATLEEREEVEFYYNINPMPGHVIESVQVMYNPVFEARFQNQLAALQSRAGNAAFPKKPWERTQEQGVPNRTPQACRRLREVVSDLFGQMSQADLHYPDVHLMPLWHATKASVVQSLGQAGFFPFASLDAGFFGRGIYFTPDAAYAHGVYASKTEPSVLFLNWVAAYAVYPVMEWDNLLGQTQQTTHDAHFVLVKRRTPNPADPNYDAQAPDLQNHYSEVVIFDPTVCLPRYVVTLKPSTQPDRPLPPGVCAWNEGLRLELWNPLLALYHFKRSWNLYDHAPAQGKIQMLEQRHPQYQGLFQPFTSSLKYLSEELQKQLHAGQSTVFRKGLEAFSHTLNQSTGEQPYFEVAKNLEKMATSTQLSGSSPSLKALLLACWNRCLFLGFVQSGGITQPLLAQTMSALQAIVPPDRSPEAASLQEELAFLLYTADLFEYQSKNPNDPRLIPMAQQLHRLITLAVDPSQWTQTLDALAASYEVHPFLGQEQRGLVLLLRALRTNPQVCILEPVVAWVQGQVAQEVGWGQADPIPCHWLLSLTALQFCLTSLQTAPLDLAESILLGNKNRIGLRHWFENLLILDQKFAEKSWCAEVLCTPLFLSQNTAHRTEPLFQALKSKGWNLFDALNLLRSHPDAATAYQGQQLYVDYRTLQGQVTWQDYQEFGRRAQGIAPQRAQRAYERAKILLEKGYDTEQPPCEADQKALEQISQSLSELYFQEGQNLSHENQAAALKFYLKAWEEQPKLLPLLPGQEPWPLNDVQRALVLTALPLDNSWPIRMRLKTFARPLRPDETLAVALQAGHTVLSGPFSGVWVIEKASPVLKQLFDGSQIRPSNVNPNGTLEGRHRVACVGSSPNQLHIKENPSCPGLAFAAWSLVHLIFRLNQTEISEVLVPVEPFKIQRPTQNGVSLYYAQASPTVLGPTFKDFLNQGSSLETLDPVALGTLTITSLLLDPEDARPANFIVEGDGPTRRLVSVDHDHVWVREEVFEEKLFKKLRPRVKSIVYCLPHMVKPVNEMLKKVFLTPSFSFLEVLKMWLLGLAFYNTSLSKIFPKDERQRLFDRLKEDEKIVLEAYFHPEQLGRLYLRGMRLKAVVENPEQTYFGLLGALQPRLGSLYQQASVTKSTPQECFEWLTSGLFTSAGGTKTTNTQLVQMVMDRTLKDYQDFEKYQTSPQDLLPFLKSFLTHLHHNGAVAEFVIQNMRSGYLTLFRDQPGVQAHVLKRIDWQTFSPTVLTPTFHENILNAISSDLEELTFKQHPLLNDEELVVLLERLPRLKMLTLRGCPRLTGESVTLKMGLWGLQTRIVGSFIEPLAQKNLQVLVVQNCQNILPVLLEQLFQYYGENREVKIIFKENPLVGMSWEVFLKNKKGEQPIENYLKNKDKNISRWIAEVYL